MKADSILEETWRVKDELARAADYDLRKIFERLRAYERVHTEAPRIRSVEELKRLARAPETNAAMVLNDKAEPD